MANRTQRDRALDWLKTHGELTTREAVTELNIMSLTKRISELRRDGIGIRTEWRKSSTGAKYGVYSLAE